MRRTGHPWIVLTLASLGAWSTLAASQAVPSLLPDGTLLKGIDGRVIRSGDRWLLEPEVGIRQGAAVLDKGKMLEILPSAALEALAAAAVQRPVDRYRLSGQIQTYHGRNSLFVLSFVALPAAAGDANSVTATAVDRVQEPNQVSGPNAAAKGDPLAIPEQIRKRLATYQATRQRQPSPTGTVAPASPRVLLDQVGLIVQDQGRTFFVTDGLGQNAQSRVFDLLPSGTLESMEHTQLQSAEPVRFRVAGLVTEYHKQPYLLVYRATREPHYGNFGR
jgi:hypothetical protein